MRTRLTLILALVLTLVVALVALVVTPLVPAQADDTPAGQLVSDVAAPSTPHVLDGRVYSVVQVGNTIILGGTFTRVRNDGETTQLVRNGLVAFDATTGRISTTFVPNPNGGVRVVLPSGDGTSVYVGGGFTTIAGATRQRVARVRVADGGLVTAFNAGAVTGEVKDLALRGGRVWMAGAFTHVGGRAQKALVTLNPTTGAWSTYMSLAIDGVHNSGVTQVMKMDVSPDGSRLVAIGNFDTLAGVRNHQLFVLDLTGPSAVPSTFRTTFYTTPCSQGFDSYMRDVDVSPDGTWFVVGTTGAYGGSTGACDTVARFELSAGADVAPSWVDYTGGDTTYSVEATGSVVYVGGHERWWNNPFAGDSAGAGAISREGIAALDPVNGLPFTWNPGRDKGVGVFDFLFGDSGLWVASDTDRIGNYQLKSRIARFPRAGVNFPAVRTPTLPGDVFIGGPVGAATAPGVLYRVNAGGPALAAASGPDWEADTDAEPSAWHVAGSNRASYSPVPVVDSTVPGGTPSALFDDELWDPSGGPEQAWSFPVPAGVPVQVRLYFANRCDCTAAVGQRRFAVDVDGAEVIADLDLVAANGHGVATMRSFDVTSDGSLDVQLRHLVENPLINGIEVIRTDVGATPAAPLRRRSFDGTTVGPTGTVPAGDVGWSANRGAFMINGDLYAAQSDGLLTRRTFDGTSYGPVTTVNTSDQIVALTAWRTDISNATGMFFDRGRIYFTLSGSNQLFYRYFSPQSGAVGAQRLVASGNVAGIDFSQVRGMFVTQSSLYWGQGDGNLRRIGWAQQGPSGVPIASTATTVSGPGLDGADWAAHALFLYQGTGGSGAGVTAAFDQSCAGVTCSFDGSASRASGSPISSYAWTFGDGQSGVGVSPSHTYAAPGTYSATLTVTSASGGSSSTTHAVVISAQTLTQVAATAVSANAQTHRVVVPSAVRAGDRLVLHATVNDSTVTVTGPAGWAQVDRVDGAGVLGRSWTKVATGTDAGAAVVVTASGAVKGDLSLGAYRSSTGATVIAAHAAAIDAVSGVQHTSPTVDLTTPGAWIVTAWVAKSSADVTWTLATGAVRRASIAGSGSGRLTSVLADSGAGESVGSAGGISATSSIAVGRTVMFTTAIAPG